MEKREVKCSVVNVFFYDKFLLFFLTFNTPFGTKIQISIISFRGNFNTFLKNVHILKTQHVIVTCFYPSLLFRLKRFLTPSWHLCMILIFTGVIGCWDQMSSV